MAIKVNGTTVIDDSRNLVNIASGAGSSTTIGDVGTYGLFSTSGAVNPGSTTAGSNLKWTNAAAYEATTSPTISGTWRAMGITLSGFGFSPYSTTSFVRIS